MSTRCFLVLLALAAFWQQAAFADPSVGPAERFERAEELRRNGESEAALQELTRLRTDYPDNVDYALARALVLTRLQRRDEALAEYDAAIELAPDYKDLYTLRASLLANRPEKPRPWTLLLGAGYENLSDGFPSWDNQFTELHFEKDEHRRYHVRVARDARYSEADLSFGLGAEHKWEQGYFAGADLGLSNDPRYQPEIGYSAHVGKAFGDGWVADLRYRRREYETATVGSYIGAIEKYYGPYRLAYSLGWSRLHGTSSFTNHVVTANWYYSDEASIGITLNDGNEAESLGNGRVLETDVRGVTLNGRRAINERVAIQWWLGLHEQGDYYRRRFLGMAVSIGI